ncbi:hypothetical protein WMY93_024783 [Mugilogobius chulae]|uniref:Ig-like domain-containing protein n=1 Tax=Mugilogobius chulae TaxID=88201 RepID=A0AAW0N1K8_9GOBI
MPPFQTSFEKAPPPTHINLFMLLFLVITTQSEGKTVSCDTMEMWLLFTVAGMVSSLTPRKILLDKNSKTEVIQEGSSVLLQCALEIKQSSRCRVSWLFNPKRQDEKGCEKVANDTSTDCTSLPLLPLHNVTQNNSGWYCCRLRVEIPILEQNDSNWTELRVELGSTSQTGVTNQENSFVWTDWWMWIAAGVAGVFLLILVIVAIVLRRKHLRQRDLECPIYANTHSGHSSKQPSPRPRPMDNTLKRDSSYQNLRTPDVSKRYERSRRLTPSC